MIISASGVWSRPEKKLKNRAYPSICPTPMATIPLAMHSTFVFSALSSTGIAAIIAAGSGKLFIRPPIALARVRDVFDRIPTT
jgi:hypothetical protein